MRGPVAAAALAAAAVLLTGAARDTPEDAYAKLIAGKVMGQPQSCLDTNRTSTQLSAVGDKLIWQENRSTVWVNQTTGGCEGVARGDILISKRYQNRACRGDISRTVDPVARFYTGSCSLGDFVPYRSR